MPMTTFVWILKIFVATFMGSRVAKFRFVSVGKVDPQLKEKLFITQ